jgi:hypothetical protein
MPRNVYLGCSQPQLGVGRNAVESLDDIQLDRVGWVGTDRGTIAQAGGRPLRGLNLLREDDANSFGVESAGVWQVRGNGNLALTKRELLFAQWMPNRLLADSTCLDRRGDDV